MAQQGGGGFAAFAQPGAASGGVSGERIFGRLGSWLIWKFVALPTGAAVDG